MERRSAFLAFVGALACFVAAPASAQQKLEITLGETDPEQTMYLICYQLKDGDNKFAYLSSVKTVKFKDTGDYTFFDLIKKRGLVKQEPAFGNHGCRSEASMESLKYWIHRYLLDDGSQVEEVEWPGPAYKPFGSDSQAKAGVKATGPAQPKRDEVARAAEQARAEAAAARKARQEEFARKQAEYETGLAQHRKALQDREAAVAAENARIDAARKAAADKLAQHERELAEYRERLAQRDRDAAAVRAEWAARAAAVTGSVVETQPTEIRQVRSLGLFNSEASARKSLLENNGARNGPNWAPITNIQCSTVIDLGKQKWICTGEQARAQRPTTASGQ